MTEVKMGISRLKLTTEGKDLDDRVASVTTTASIRLVLFVLVEPGTQSSMPVL